MDAILLSAADCSISDWSLHYMIGRHSECSYQIEIFQPKREALNKMLLINIVVSMKPCMTGNATDLLLSNSKL